MHLLVGNPTAQSGRNRDRIARARELLDIHGLHHEFLATLPDGATVAAVEQAARSGRFDTVVAMGGDGTFREVGAGLLDSGAPVVMGMLPTGTANDQGRSFGMSAAPEALDRNVAILAERNIVPLDAGKLIALQADGAPHGATTWFFDSAGWGMSARVLRWRNEDRAVVGHVPILRELYRDKFVYAGAVLQAFLASYVENQDFACEVRTPDRVVHLSGISDLIVKNTRYYAGAWVFDDSASPEDGLMELVPLRGRNELIARALVAHEQVPLFAEELPPGFQLSEIFRAPWFELAFPPDNPMVEVQVDGEEHPPGYAWRVEVVRHAIQLIVPGHIEST
jgi:diacylglycerol kinase family enzyme